MTDRRLLAAILLALTLGVYAQVGSHTFVSWDDPAGILENTALRAEGPVEAVGLAFSSTLNANWIPLTVLSLQLNHAAHGLEPGGYLRTNVALHAAAVLLLFFALARMTGSPGPAFFVAAVFAVHPLHVESVAWASARKDSLSGLFFMACLLAHARHAERPRPGSQALVLLCVAAALLSKPTAVTLPCVLLLLDYWPLRRLSQRRAWLEKLPQLALVAVACAVTLAVQSASRATSYGELMSPGVRVVTAIEAYAIYLKQSVWPSGLAFYYPHPATIGAISPLDAVLPALLLAALSAAAFLLRGSRPHLLVGWLWYLGTLVPVIGLVQVGAHARADRYTYLPLVGLSIAVVWELARATQRHPRARAAVAVLGAAAVLALAGAAWRQAAVWKDTITLKAHAIAVTEPNAIAHQGLGVALRRAGRLDEAAVHLRRATELNAVSAEPLLELADLEARRGNEAEALRLVRRAVREHPGHARARANLGMTLARAGRRDEARPELERALELGPPRGVPPRRWASVRFALARLYLEAGDVEAARQHYAVGLRDAPDNRAARENLERISR